MDLKELQSVHGDVRAFNIGGVEVAFKAPTQGNWEAFVNSVASDKSTENKAVAIRSLVLSCVVEPSKDDVKALFVKYPAAPATISTAITEMANGGIVELGKE